VPSPKKSASGRKEKEKKTEPRDESRMPRGGIPRLQKNDSDKRGRLSEGDPPATAGDGRELKMGGSGKKINWGYN